MSGQLSLDGQVAVVTGGGAGIGRGIAASLAGAGADVAILDIDPERAETTAARVRSLGRDALVVPTDALESGEVRAGVGQAADRFGRLDVLVNNVGGVRGRPFLEQSERSWRRHLDLNLVSVFAATAAAAPVMIEGGRGGSILNVASIEAFRAAPGYAVYAAAKAGMISFTKTIALELADHGIRVNALAPDKTATPGLRGFGVGDSGQEPGDEPAPVADRSVPLGREGHIDECGSLAVFLCSDAGSYLTGTTTHIDGGVMAAGGWTRSETGEWTVG